MELKVLQKASEVTSKAPPIWLIWVDVWEFWFDDWISWLFKFVEEIDVDVDVEVDCWFNWLEVWVFDPLVVLVVVETLIQAPDWII